MQEHDCRTISSSQGKASCTGWQSNSSSIIQLQSSQPDANCASAASHRQDLQRAASQIDAIQQNFPGLNLANAASMVTSQQQVATAQPATGNSQVNFITQLLNASTQQAPSGSASRNIFAATTVTVVDPEKPDTRTRNPKVPKRVVPGVKCLLDTSEMEFSDLPPCDESALDLCKELCGRTVFPLIH